MSETFTNDPVIYTERICLRDRVRDVKIPERVGTLEVFHWSSKRATVFWAQRPYITVIGLARLRLAEARSTSEQTEERDSRHLPSGVWGGEGA